MWCTVQAKDGCLVKSSVHCSAMESNAAQCNGIQGKIVFCALQFQYILRHCAKVSKAGLYIVLCNAIKVLGRVQRYPFKAGLSIAYCKVECFRNQVSIAVHWYPRHDHVFRFAMLSKCMAQCKGIQGRIVYSKLQA